ncbi:GtrA family protein [Pseudomonas sp. RIT-PI-S]|uniref:GtrA family protein n=1 Tax=Pseudomonas sp. RIT-PI-S TaxID=3035295 RepID=UPI0021DA271B|nr:GtrA family protein [Pseudomonas sp. RIT-PI-S]
MNTAALQPLLRYACVGVMNTLVHTCVFLWLVYEAGLRQAPANLAAFVLAVTFSYCANARWTFRAAASLRRYLLFSSFMALLALATGAVAQALAWAPLLTLCLFSALSLMLGYAYPRGVVFKPGGR